MTSAKHYFKLKRMVIALDSQLRECPLNLKVGVAMVLFGKTLCVRKFDGKKYSESTLCLNKTKNNVAKLFLRCAGKKKMLTLKKPKAP